MEDIRPTSKFLNRTDVQLTELKVLEKGSFSQTLKVELTTPSETGLFTAKKRLSGPESTSPYARQYKSFFNEYQTIKELRHVNIISVKYVKQDPNMDDVTSNSPIYIYCIEHTKHGSLFSVLNKDIQPIGSDQFFNWCIQGTRALEYIHGKDIAHRDIRSANFLVMENGTLKLSGFSCAVYAKDQAYPSSGILTDEWHSSYGWKAPGALSDHNVVSKLDDTYSIAVTFWEILTKQVPFNNVDGKEIYTAVVHRHERPVIPSSCPLRLKELLDQCWVANRNNRPKIHNIRLFFEEMKNQGEIVREEKTCFTSGSFDERGGYLRIGNSSVSMFIPPGAIKTERGAKVEMYLCTKGVGFIRDESQVLLSPVVTCRQGNEFEFRKPVILTIPHCAKDIDKWNISIYRKARNGKVTDDTEDSLCMITDKVVKLSLSHFCKYAAVGKAKSKKDPVEIRISVCPFGKPLNVNLKIYQFRMRTWHTDAGKQNALADETGLNGSRLESTRCLYLKNTKKDVIVTSKVQKPSPWSQKENAQILDFKSLWAGDDTPPSCTFTLTRGDLSDEVNLICDVEVKQDGENKGVHFTVALDTSEQPNQSLEKIEVTSYCHLSEEAFNELCELLGTENDLFDWRHLLGCYNKKNGSKSNIRRIQSKKGDSYACAEHVLSLFLSNTNSPIGIRYLYDIFEHYQNGGMHIIKADKLGAQALEHVGSKRRFDISHSLDSQPNSDEEDNVSESEDTGDNIGDDDPGNDVQRDDEQRDDELGDDHDELGDDELVDDSTSDHEDNSKISLINEDDASSESDAFNYERSREQIADDIQKESDENNHRQNLLDVSEETNPNDTCCTNYCHEKECENCCCHVSCKRCLEVSCQSSCCEIKCRKCCCVISLTNRCVTRCAIL